MVPVLTTELVGYAGDGGWEMIHAAVHSHDPPQNGEPLRIIHNRGIPLPPDGVQMNHPAVSDKAVVPWTPLNPGSHNSSVDQIANSSRLQEHVVTLHAAERSQFLRTRLNKEGAILSSQPSVQGEEGLCTRGPLTAPVFGKGGKTGDGNSLSIQVHSQNFHAP